MAFLESCGLTYSLIDHCRGDPALAKFIITELDGTLVSNIWGADPRHGTIPVFVLIADTSLGRRVLAEY